MCDQRIDFHFEVRWNWSSDVPWTDWHTRMLTVPGTPNKEVERVATGMELEVSNELGSLKVSLSAKIPNHVQCSMYTPWNNHGSGKRPLG